MSAFNASADHLQFRHIRLKGVTDGLRARQRFESVLAGMDAAALGLPPRALLIVQRVVPAARLHLGPFGRSAAFVQSVQVELMKNVQHARRPAAGGYRRCSGGAVPDESELMACLLRDCWVIGWLNVGGGGRY